jgi:hypothetical protein
VLVVVAVAACGPRAARAPRAFGLVEPPRLAVLPFRAGGTLEPTGAFVAQPGAEPVDAEAGAEVTRRLAAALDARGLAVVDPAVVAATVAAAEPAAEATAFAAHVARTTGANAAVIGAVGRYTQREGSALGATRPASVGYQVIVVRAADGAVLGTDRFDYTQRPLNENLLDLPRVLEGGGGWMTREQILDGATRRTAERLAAWLGPPRASMAAPPP